MPSYIGYEITIYRKDLRFFFQVRKCGFQGWNEIVHDFSTMQSLPYPMSHIGIRDENRNLLQVTLVDQDFVNGSNLVVPVTLIQDLVRVVTTARQKNYRWRESLSSACVKCLLRTLANPCCPADWC